MNHNVIEPGVKPVCDALNSLPGVQTRWSCEGHPERPSRPYVTFKASSDTAFKIHCWLGSGRAGGLLNHCWWMVANFDDSGSLQYTIEPNDISFPVYRGGFFRRARSRSRSELDAELLRLSRVILELADSLNTEETTPAVQDGDTADEGGDEGNAAAAALAYALDYGTEEPLEFLRCWYQGDFDVIRNEWPDAPAAVFIGADSLYKPA